MKRNVGSADRVIRLILGVFLLAVGLAYSSVLGLVLGAVVLFTAVTAWCPLYSALGISTDKDKTGQVKI